MKYKLMNERKEGITLLEQVFLNRGMPLENIKHYLETDDKDILDPSIITNIKDGVALLVKHIGEGSKVFLQIDSDCDGFTSSAFLLNYLNRIFPGFVQNNIVYRPQEEKVHGIILDTVPEDVSLVIVPDASSDEFDKHKILKDKGIDILIIDHHHTSKYSEYACVINNQLDGYPTKSLSGVGMVYKFCQYLDKLLGTAHAEDLIDLASLGIIADAMDLKDFETRRIVDKGLKNIKNPYIKGMISKNSYSFKEGITPHSISFHVAPAVNAIARVGTNDEKLVLFESMLEFKAYEQIPSTKRGARGQFETVVEQSCRNSTNVRNRQNKSRDTMQENIEKLIKEKDLLKNKILLIQTDGADETVKSITGLVANKLMSIYQRPILILHKRVDDKGNITWEGSGRNAGTSLKSFRNFLLNSNLVMYAQGHDNALGVGIEDKNLEAFINYSNSMLEHFDFSSQYKVDEIYQGSKIDTAEIMSLASLEHIWGQGVTKPLIAIENLRIGENNVNLYTGNTLKISIPNQKISLIKFKISDEDYEDLMKNNYCYINVIGTCSINSWDNSPQIKIEDYEITKRLDYLF